MFDSRPPTRFVRRLRDLFAVTLVVALLLPCANATWSVVLMNRLTREIVISSCTCLPNFDLQVGVPVVRVGVGAAAAQSLVDNSGQNRQLIFEQLAAGTTPEEILALLAASDPTHNARQYGIVNGDDPAVKFTGGAAGKAKKAIAGEFGVNGEWSYAVQGNVLTDQDVIFEAVATLTSAPGDASQRVLAAMETARALGGDGRCSCGFLNPTGCGAPPPEPFKSAHVGFFIVARLGDTDGICNSTVGCATGDYTLAINIIGAGNQPDPVFQIAEQYDAWRATRIGRVDHLLTSVELGAQSLNADGVSTTSATVRLIDIDGTPLATTGATLGIASSSSDPLVGTYGPIQDNGDGSYTFDVTADTQAGLDELVITVDDGVEVITLSPYPKLRFDPPARLHCGFESVSSSSGASVPLTVSVGPDDMYWVLASASGTNPGIPALNLVVPLNPDPILTLTLVAPNLPPLEQTFGTTDAAGRALATLDVAPGVLDPLVGGRIDFAALLQATPGASPLDVSTTVGFDIVP